MRLKYSQLPTSEAVVDSIGLCLDHRSTRKLTGFLTFPGSPVGAGQGWGRIGDITGLYEKVIKVKADVAAVLVSATQRFREWRWTLSRAPFFGVHSPPSCSRS